MISKKNIDTVFDCFNNPNDYILDEELLKNVLLGIEI